MKKFLILSILFIVDPVFAVTSIEVQALFSNKAVVMIDGARRTLTEGVTSPEGVILISATSRSATLEVDGVEKEYKLGSKVSLSYSEPLHLEERLFADDRGMFLRTGTINGRTVRFLVDTGATTVAMNRQQAKRLGIRYRLDGKVSGASTASGYVKAYEVKLKSVSLGKIKQKNVSAMVIDGDHPGPILLGMSFLSNLKVDKSGGTLLIRQKK